MDENELWAAFEPMYAQFVDLVQMPKKPLLSHYTSLDSLEKITKSEEIWFSNPLFMNDLQEVRFGIVEAHNIFMHEFNEESFVNEIGPDRALSIRNAFGACYYQFENDHVFSLYVFCLSEHGPDDKDGLLSMWRGYGANGGGAAIVLNMDFVTKQQKSPLMIGKVQYATDFERRQWIRMKVRETRDLVRNNVIEDSLLSRVSANLFDLLKVNALLTKHKGFSEEREWRVIYFPDLDTQSLLSDGFTYIIGKNGVEPKLKFPMKPLPFGDRAVWTFEQSVDRIILGPSLSSVLATKAVKKMFESLNKKSFAEKVIASTIPFRHS
jgi:hypothetical protein